LVRAARGPHHPWMCQLSVIMPEKALSTCASEQTAGGAVCAAGGRACGAEEGWGGCCRAAQRPLAACMGVNHLRAGRAVPAGDEDAQHAPRPFVPIKPVHVKPRVGRFRFEIQRLASIYRSRQLIGRAEGFVRWLNIMVDVTVEAQASVCRRMSGSGFDPALIWGAAAAIGCNCCMPPPCKHGWCAK